MGIGGLKNSTFPMEKLTKNLLTRMLLRGCPQFYFSIGKVDQKFTYTNAFKGLSTIIIIYTFDNSNHNSLTPSPPSYDRVIIL